MFDGNGDNPHAVLTGDTLFIGDVGRPDLRASLGWTAEELGALLYDSIHDKLLVLPDETLVYPAHGAGSLCGKNMSEDTVSTIGIQQQYNYALQPMTSEEFIRIVCADQPDTPDYFTYDAILNTKQHPILEAALSHGLKPLTIERVHEQAEAGSQLLDTRAPSDFAGAHLVGCLDVGFSEEYIAGSINVPLSKLGAYLEQGIEGDVVVHCAGGYRSSVAASLIMRQLPAVPVADLVGGLEAREAAGLPTVKESG